MLPCPLTPQQIDELVQKFKDRFGKEPEGIYLVGSNADGSATADSDIDLVMETDLPLTKFSGPGFEFFKEINPGKIPTGIRGIGIGPGLTTIGTDPGEIAKPGLLDPFFRLPGKVWPPSVKLR